MQIHISKFFMILITLLMVLVMLNISEVSSWLLSLECPRLTHCQTVTVKVIRYLKTIEKTNEKTISWYLINKLIFRGILALKHTCFQCKFPC